MMLFRRIAASMILTGWVFNLPAQSDNSNVDICRLLANPGQYDRQRFDLEANVVAEPHGYHLVGKECPGLSVRLIFPEGTDSDDKFAELMRHVMTHRAKSHARMAGRFYAAQSDNEVGRFKIDDVLSIGASK